MIRDQDMTLYAVICALTGALLLFMCQNYKGVTTKALAVFFPGICCLLSWQALSTYSETSDGTVFLFPLQIFNGTAIPLSLRLQEDIFSSSLSLLIFVIAFFTILLMPSFYKDRGNTTLFSAKILASSSILNLVVMADNPITLFVTFMFTGLITAALVRFYHDKLRAMQASFTVFIVNLAADSVLLIAAIASAAYLQSNTYFAGLFAAIFCLFAFLIKSGLAGSSIWVAESSEAPSLATSFITSVILPSCALAMFCMTQSLLEEFKLLNIVLFFAISGIFLGAFSACIQFKIKRILSYSSLSETSLILFTACISKDFFLPLSLLIIHSLGKTLLFTSYASVTLAASGEEDIRTIGGVGRILKFSAAYNLIGCMLMIIPFFIAAGNSNSLICTSVCAVASALTVIYTLRPFFKVFCGKLFGEDAVIARLVKEPFIVTFLSTCLFCPSIIFLIKVCDKLPLENKNAVLLLGNICFTAFVYATFCFIRNVYLSTVLENKYPAFYALAKDGFGSYKIYHRIAPLIARKVGSNLSGKIGKTIIMIGKTADDVKNKTAWLMSLKNISDIKLYVSLFVSAIILIITAYFTLKGMQ